MSAVSHSEHQNHSLSGEVEAHTGVPVAKCYQCGKCSAGCPVADEMDFPPSMVMRMLQTEMPELEEKLLRSHTIWLCLACELCISRCPMEIDIPKVMDYLREKSLKENKTNPKAKNIIAFHKAFLNSIKSSGRLHEVGVIGEYKMQSLNLMQDVMLAPSMFAKGKLSLFAEKINDKALLKRIFSKTLNK